MELDDSPPRDGKSSKGFFVSKTRALLILVLFLFLLILIGLIAGLSGRSSTAKTEESGNGGEVASTSSPVSKKVRDVRLPNQLSPIFYDVTLRPYLEEADGDKRFSFDGQLLFAFSALHDASNITLHIKDLNISADSIMVHEGVGHDPGNMIGFDDWIHDEDREFFVLPLKGNLKEGMNYTIMMNYVGNLNDLLIGFYRSKYEIDGKEVYLATTQMQPTDARRAFPCLDEPGIKAEFRITIKNEDKYEAISNMPASKGFPKTENGLKVTKFDPTVKMSTYLLAFVVSDFKYKEASTPTNNIKIRVWARPNAIDRVDYALDIGVKVLDYFENYFKVKYPLPKQDMIALPDFGAGAMENWGLITYRETALLYNNKTSSLGNRQRVCLVVAHELAHQWFGNLVTPEWWDDLWLNEGFASYVENLGIEHAEPDLKIMDQFVTNEVQYVFNADSLASSHPIYQEVGHPDEINEIFDSISYSKGSSILRMMNFFLTEGTMTNGLANYLNDFKFKNAVSKDLWDALTAQAKKENKDIDVAAIMDTWTLQMGFPVVTASLEQDGSKVRVEQARFLLDPNATSAESPFDYKWDIPFTVTTQKNPQWNSANANIRWLMRDSTTKEFPVDADPENWIVANVEQMGYYRVNYPESNWQKIVAQLNSNHKLIDVKNRAQIIDDAFSLAQAGHLGYDIAFSTTSYLKNEEELIPWKAVNRKVGYISTMLSMTNSFGLYLKYIKRLASPRFKEVGFEPRAGVKESPTTIYLRSYIISMMCSADEEECLQQALELLRKWKDQGTEVSPDIRSEVYYFGVRAGNLQDWDFVFTKFKESDDASEKGKLLRALTATKEPWLLQRLLDMSLEGKDIRKQDAGSAIGGVAGNDIGSPIAWDFFRANWEKIIKNFGVGSFTLPNIVKRITGSFASEYRLEQLQDFIRLNPDQGSAKRAFQQAIEKTKTNIEWLKKNYAPVSDWLEKDNQKS